MSKGPSQKEREAFERGVRDGSACRNDHSWPHGFFYDVHYRPPSDSDLASFYKEGWNLGKSGKVDYKK